MSPRLTLGSLLLAAAAAYEEPQKFLIVTSPSTHTVAYRKVLTSGIVEAGSAARTLIGDGLLVPQGIAVDEYRHMLYVADPDLGKLVGYPLMVSGDALAVGGQKTIATGVETRWVAVDGLGNVFFTDEADNSLRRVTAQMIEAGQTTAQTLYSGTTTPSLMAPGGLVADNYGVFWVNKARGTQIGTLVAARADGSSVTNGTAGGPSVLANNAMKCYGVCKARDSLFFSDEQFNLFGVKTNGGEVTTISLSFQEARGCAFDGDGTVYVADKIANAVYQFPANMAQLTNNIPMTKAADFMGAFGVAVYHDLDTE